MTRVTKLRQRKSRIGQRPNGRYDPIKDRKSRKQDRRFRLPPDPSLPGSRPQKRETNSQTSLKKDIKDHVANVIRMAEEKFLHHMSSFKAGEDIYSLMWVLILEEAVPSIEARFIQAASLEGFLDVDMTDAPPLFDDDGDYLMVL